MQTYGRPTWHGSTMTKALGFVGLLVSAMMYAEATPSTARLDIVNQADASVDRDGPFAITVVARGLSVTLEGALFTVTDDATGKDLSKAFSLPSNPKLLIDAEHSATVSFLVDGQKLAGVVSAKGGLVLQFKAVNSPKMLLTDRWGFKLTHAVPDLTVSSRPNDLIRPFPFRPLSFTADDAKACNSYQLSPAILPIDSNLKASGDAFTAKSDAARPQGAKIGAALSKGNVCFGATIPGQYTELKAKFHLDDVSIKKPVDFDADLRVKDHWAWRALAAFLATLLSLALIVWTTTIRRRILNRNERDEVTNRLAQFLASNPGLGNDSSVTLIRQMILDSTVEDKTGDFDASVQSLASANSRLDQLFASPPTVPVLLSQSGQAIRILNPAPCVVSGRKISFVIGQPNPNWPTSAGTYLWTLTAPDGTVPATREGVELKRFDFTFHTSGPFVMAVSVNGANPESRGFSVLVAPPPSVIEQFMIVQWAVFAITFLLAVGTAYVSTQDASTFGTFGDYLSLIAKAFGVSGGAGGVATVLSAVKGK